MSPDTFFASAQIAGLMYHEITDDTRTSGFQRPAARQCVVTTHLFEQHMDVIEKSTLRPELVHQMDPRIGQHLLLTFDDGGRSALSAAAVLARRNWKAHFFIVTSRIGDRTFLDEAGIRELVALGHTVGTHSHTHPDIFWDLPRPKMVEEWRTSREILQSITGVPCVVGSVPGGDMSRETMESANECGLQYLFTSEPWLQPRRVDNCWVMGRFIMRPSLSPEMLHNVIRMQGWKRARVERWIKLIARRGMGPLYGMYVRRVTRSDEPAETVNIGH